MCRPFCHDPRLVRNQIVAVPKYNRTDDCRVNRLSCALEELLIRERERARQGDNFVTDGGGDCCAREQGKGDNFVTDGCGGEGREGRG